MSNFADKTLHEQMRIGDVELQQRKDLLGLSESVLAILPKYQSMVGVNAHRLVDEFYEIQLKIEEVSLIIGDADTLKMLRHAQHAYILELFGGDYGARYVNSRLRIGLVHKRIGVEPKLFLAAVHNLKSVLNAFFAENIKDSVELGALTSALDRLLYFDMTLVFDTYIQGLVAEIHIAKQKTERYASNLEVKFADRTRELEEIARRDALTGLLNQRMMREVLAQEIATAQKNGQPLGLVYLDADNFKEINDKLGHLKGDEILVTVGRLLSKHVGHGNYAFRHGGDEFCVLLNGHTEIMLQDWCERWAMDLQDHEPEVRFSAGYVQIGPTKYLSVEDFITAADRSMYGAKQKARLLKFQKQG